MKLSFEYVLNDIVPDYTHEPAWAGKIKRWSQLDKESLAVAEATSRYLPFLGNPQQLIILSSQGSSQTDSLFAHSKKISPSYFVHTLPNVRSLVFSTLTAWEGPVFCFSQGKYSLVRFLHEVATVHHQVKTLILNLNRVEQVYQCDFYKVGMGQTDSLNVLEYNGEVSSNNFLLDDFTFRTHLQSESLIHIKNDLTIRKIS